MNSRYRIGKSWLAVSAAVAHHNLKKKIVIVSETDSHSAWVRRQFEKKTKVSESPYVTFKSTENEPATGTGP